MASFVQMRIYITPPPPLLVVARVGAVLHVRAMLTNREEAIPNPSSEVV